MRKLLLSSTAIASAAVLTANIAVADIAITAGTEWTYVSQSSQITANDGTSFGTDAEIKFIIGLVSRSANVMAIIIEINNSKETTKI